MCYTVFELFGVFKCCVGFADQKMHSSDKTVTLNI